MEKGNHIGEQYEFSGFRLNAVERTLKRGEVRIALTPRMFDLLLTLVRSDGHLLSKEELLTSVWSDATVEEGNLNRTISSLRKVLGETRGDNRYIETVPKIGYRFVGVVDRSLGERTSGETVLVKMPQRRSLSWIWAVAAFFFIFGALASTYFVLPERMATVNVSGDTTGQMLRLTDTQFEDDHAEWTFDGKIRFTRYVTVTRAESWIMNGDGSDQRRANDKIPSLRSGQWSPNGKQVVFVKDGETSKNVYLANADGTGERRINLTHPPNDWSADGTHFVYAEQIDKTNSEIFVYDIASGVSVNISRHAAFDADPLFTPDDKQITFVSNRDGNNEAYLMNIDGSNIRRLTNHAAIDSFPAVSPDGTQVVFDSNREGENVDLFIKDIDNDLPPRKLTTLSSNEEHRGGCWSPDGSKLLITSDQTGKSNIYLISSESFAPTLVLADPRADLLTPIFAPTDRDLVFQARYEDKSVAIERVSLDGTRNIIYKTDADTVNTSLSPALSPDGRTIVFANRVEGNTDLFIVAANGGEALNISNSPTAEGSPSFSADGSRVYFHSDRAAQFGRFSIFSVDLAGSNLKRLTSREGYEFSPLEYESSVFLYSCDREDGVSKSLDICRMTLEKNLEERIVSRRFHDTQPAFSARLGKIAFVSQSEGNNEIFLVGLDGRGLVRLTNDPADDMYPQFHDDFLYYSSNKGGKYAIFKIDLSSYSLMSANRR